jgi:hypothetical protein
MLMTKSLHVNFDRNEALGIARADWDRDWQYEVKLRKKHGHTGLGLTPTSRQGRPPTNTGTSAATPSAAAASSTSTSSSTLVTDSAAATTSSTSAATTSTSSMDASVSSGTSSSSSGVDVSVSGDTLTSSSSTTATITNTDAIISSDSSSAMISTSLSSSTSTTNVSSVGDAKLSPRAGDASSTSTSLTSPPPSVTTISFSSSPLESAVGGNSNSAVKSAGGRRLQRRASSRVPSVGNASLLPGGIPPAIAVAGGANTPDRSLPPSPPRSPTDTARSIASSINSTRSNGRRLQTANGPRPNPVSPIPNTGSGRRVPPLGPSGESMSPWKADRSTIGSGGKDGAGSAIGAPSSGPPPSNTTSALGPTDTGYQFNATGGGLTNTTSAAVVPGMIVVNGRLVPIPGLSKLAVMHALFEIVDIWTVSLDPDEYVHFLATLYHRITKLKTWTNKAGIQVTKFVWRRLPEVRASSVYRPMKARAKGLLDQVHPGSDRLHRGTLGRANSLRLGGDWAEDGPPDDTNDVKRKDRARRRIERLEREEARRASRPGGGKPKKPKKNKPRKKVLRIDGAGNQYVVSETDDDQDSSSTDLSTPDLSPPRSPFLSPGSSVDPSPPSSPTHYKKFRGDPAFEALVEEVDNPEKPVPYSVPGLEPGRLTPVSISRSGSAAGGRPTTGSRSATRDRGLLDATVATGKPLPFNASEPNLRDQFVAGAGPRPFSAAKMAAQAALEAAQAAAKLDPKHDGRMSEVSQAFLQDLKERTFFGAMYQHPSDKGAGENENGLGLGDSMKITTILDLSGGPKRMGGLGKRSSHRPGLSSTMEGEEHEGEDYGDDGEGDDENDDGDLYRKNRDRNDDSRPGTAGGGRLPTGTQIEGGLAWDELENQLNGWRNTQVPDSSGRIDHWGGVGGGKALGTNLSPINAPPRSPPDADVLVIHGDDTGSPKTPGSLASPKSGGSLSDSSPSSSRLNIQYGRTLDADGRPIRHGLVSPAQLMARTQTTTIAIGRDVGGVVNSSVLSSRRVPRPPMPGSLEDPGRPIKIVPAAELSRNHGGSPNRGGRRVGSPTSKDGRTGTGNKGPIDLGRDDPTDDDISARPKWFRSPTTAGSLINTLNRRPSMTFVPPINIEHMM